MKVQFRATDKATPAIKRARGSKARTALRWFVLLFAANTMLRAGPAVWADYQVGNWKGFVLGSIALLWLLAVAWLAWTEEP